MLLVLGAIGTGVTATVAVWLWHIQNGYRRGSAQAAAALSPNRWTDEDIDETMRQLMAHPLDWTPHLPPAQQRRYIVLGGSGVVGSAIILQLLARGQSPKSIRNIDFRKPVSSALLTGSAAEVDYVHADISNKQSTLDAFLKEWEDESVRDLPITVFHTASLINAHCRKKTFLNKITPVNIVGTENVISASKTIGVDILIYTSSGSVPVRPIKHWLPPWKSMHDNIIQPFPDPGQSTDVRDYDEYFALYAGTKARAEQMTCLANSKTLRTGCIRPCNGIYGNRADLCVGLYLREGQMPCFVRADNVALAHLDYEATIIKHPESAGKSFNVTDAGKPICAGDIYHHLHRTANFKEIPVTAAHLLPLAYAIELYVLAQANIPLLGRILPQIPPTLLQLQPALFTICMVAQTATNDQASLPPGKGGIGYKALCTSLEGISQQVLDFAKEIDAEKKQKNV